MSYLDELDDNQLGALEMVLDELKSGRSATTSIRDILDGAPTLGKTTVLYRYYKTSSFKGRSEVDRMYSFEEDEYLVLSSKKLPTKSGATVLAFKFTSTSKAIPIGDDAYLFDRGTVYYIADSDSEWVATIKEALTLTASARLAPSIFFSGGPMPERCEECGMSPIQEFYNRCHSTKNGKFCEGRSGPVRTGGQNPQGRKGPPQVTKAESTLSRVANIIRSVATVVGVIGVTAGVITAYGTVNMGAGVRRQVRREGLLDQERQRQSKGRSGLGDADRQMYDFLRGSR